MSRKRWLSIGGVALAILVFGAVSGWASAAEYGTLYLDKAGTEADATWSTTQVKFDTYSALLTAGTDGGASRGRVWKPVNIPLANITGISFWYYLSSGAQADISAWPVYKQEVQTYSDNTVYMTPYVVLEITDGTNPHWIVSQPFSRDPDNGSWTPAWEQWDMTNNAGPSGGGDPIQALWHNEGFADDDPNTGGGGTYPARWEYLAFFQTLYPGYHVVKVKIVMGDWDIATNQSAYVDDFTVAAGATTYAIEPRVFIDATPYGAIPTAVAAAVDDDVIDVHPGIFSDEATAWPIDLNVANLTLQSDAGAESTIIDPGVNGQGAVEISADGVTLDGFTIKGGTKAPDAANPQEHTVWVHANASTIKNNTIIGAGGNQACLYIGGGTPNVPTGAVFGYQVATPVGHQILNNTFRYGGVGAGSGEGWGIFAYKLTHDSLIKGNQFVGDPGDVGNWNANEGAPGTGIVIHSAEADGGSYAVVIEDNTAQYLKYTWLTFYAAYQYADSGGKGYEQPEDSTVKDVLVQNNTVQNCGTAVNFARATKSDAYGVKQADLTIGNSGVSLIGNDLHGNGEGIRVDDPKHGSGGWVCVQYPNHIDARLNDIYTNTWAVGWWSTPQGLGVRNGAGTAVVNQTNGGSVKAENNWWGNATGPGPVGPGSGDKVSDNVDFTPWIQSAVTEIATGTVVNGGTVDGMDEGIPVTATVTGAGSTTVILAKYDGDPTGTGFGSNFETGYMDVYVPDVTGVTEIEIHVNYLATVLNEATLKLFWWNGTSWLECSNQGVNTTDFTHGGTAYGGYLWAKITALSVPMLSQLTGMIFGGGSGLPASTLWFENFEYANRAAMEAAGWVFGNNGENLWHLTTEGAVPSQVYPQLILFPSSTHAVWFGSEETGTYSPQNDSGSALPNPEVRAQRARIHPMGAGQGYPYGELTSPNIVVSGQDSLKVSFDYFREVEQYYQGTFDKTYVQVSFDGGAWQTVWERNSKSSSDLMWIPASIDGIPVFGEYWIPVAVPAGATNMKIRFVFDAVDNVANNYLGWLIDDVKVSSSAPAGMQIEPRTLSEGVVGQAYSATLGVVGGIAPYTWSTRFDTPVPGLGVQTGSTAVTISGTPTTAGTYTLHVNVTDARAQTYDGSYSIIIEDAIAQGGQLFFDDFENVAAGWTTGGLWHLTENVPCVSPPYASPTHVYYYGKDATCNYVTAGANSGVLTSPSITVPEGAILTIGWKYWREVESYTGVFDKTWVEYRFGTDTWTTPIWYDDSNQVKLQYGWHLVEAKGITVPAGVTSLQIRFLFNTVDGYANNYVGWLVDDVKVILQTDLSITTTCDDLAGGKVGVSYDHTLAATGGKPPYTWSMTGGPIGGVVTLNAATGQLYGTPTTAGTYPCTFTVTDSATNTASRICDIAIAGLCPCKLLEQNFDADLGGWTPGGLWHWTAPTACILCGGELSGPYVYFGQNGTCDYNTGARVLGNLTSPQFNVDSCITNLLLEFHHYRKVESYDGAYDETYVQIAWDGGAWHTVWYKDSKNASPDCADVTIGPIPRAGAKLQIRFVFDSVDALFNNFTGWAIDGVTVWNTAAGCGAPAPNVVPLSAIKPQAVAPRDQISVLNIPNPVRDVNTTTFTVRGVDVEAVKIQIFDLNQNLIYEEEVPGTELVWHTVNQYGEYLANGVYFYRAIVNVGGEWIVTKFQKLVILR